MIARIAKLVVFSGFLLFAVPAVAQNTMLQASSDQIFLDGLDLFDKDKFAAASRKFQWYLQQDDVSEEKAIQAEYYMAFAALKMQNADFESRVSNFIRRYPSHPKTQEAYFHLGSYYFDKGEYRRALDYFQNYELQRISTEEEVEAAYRLAYTYFALEDYNRAGRLFDILKNTGSSYARVASYYSGYIQFQNGNYPQALADLEKANLEGRLAQDARALMAGIYYKQGLYARIIEMVQNETSPGPELSLLAGESYFLQTDYKAALPYFENYLTENPQPEDRQTSYRIGFTLLHNNQAERATPHLSRAADGQDTLAQLGSYHLGMAYLDMQQNGQAIIALNKARNMDLDPVIKENATYYYIKASNDIGDYSSVIEGAEQYIAAFPSGTNLSEVYNLLGAAYQNTGDYDRALQYLSRIQNKSPEVRRTYQRVAYNKAVLLYNDSKYPQAVKTLKMSLQYPIDPQLAGDARFWLGEIYSLGNRFDTAIVYYRQVPYNSARYQQTLYGMGYAYYNNKDYQQAATLFQQFVQGSTTPDRDQVADARLRLADSYYVLKNYDQAIANYDMALRMDNSLADYAAYQKGRVYNAANNRDAAVQSFDYVVNNFPQSNYRAPALYQKADIYFDDGRLTEAVRLFTRLIEQFPDNNLMARAHAKRGLAAFNNGNYELAAKDQKIILNQYIDNKELAETAIEQLQRINGAGYTVYDLNQYVDKFSSVYQESDVVMKSRFDVAQQPFLEGRYLDAIGSLTRFLEQYPQGKYTSEAYFKIGFSYEQEQDYIKAVQNFKKVQGNDRAKAIKRVADISLENLGDYQDAINYYSELLQISSRQQYRNAAILGLMQAYFEINDYEATLQYANQVLEEKMTRFFSKAQLYKGKVLLAQKNYTDAIGQFQETIKLGMDESAAEAQYLIGKALHEQGDYKTSTTQLIKVKTDFESYSGWIYEAFLLIAENYIALENLAQAKATLNSIVEYSNDPAYVQRAQARLQEIES